MVRVPDFESGCCRFESYLLNQIAANYANGVHPDSNPEEEGSIPFVCSCFLNQFFRYLD